MKEEVKKKVHDGQVWSYGGGKGWKESERRMEKGGLRCESL